MFPIAKRKSRSDKKFTKRFDNINRFRSAESFADKVAEKKHHYKIYLKLAGYSKEDIDIEVRGQYLIFRSDKKDGDQYREVSKTTFALPKDTKTRNIVAEMDNGMLEITIPKKVKNENSHKIELQ